MKKTQDVYDLVNEVIKTIPTPFNETITEDVCLAIEGNPKWKIQYDDLISRLGKYVVNPYIGVYTKKITGLNVLKVVKANHSKIIESYTMLKK